MSEKWYNYKDDLPPKGKLLMIKWDTDPGPIAAKFIRMESIENCFGETVPDSLIFSFMLKTLACSWQDCHKINNKYNEVPFGHGSIERITWRELSEHERNTDREPSQ